jgi:hypothetical protein
MDYCDDGDLDENYVVEETNSEEDETQGEKQLVEKNFGKAYEDLVTKFQGDQFTKCLVPEKYQAPPVVRPVNLDRIQ